MKEEVVGISLELVQLLQEKCGVEGVKYLESEIEKFEKDDIDWKVLNIPTLDGMPDIIVPLKKEKIAENEKDLNEIIDEKSVTLKVLHKKYKELLYIEDTDRIDVVLAVALSRKLEGIPIWMIIVGASGDMKSVQLNALMEDEDTYVLHNLTSKTLVNGFKDKQKFPDLAPKLDGKLVVIPDMAQILKLHPNEKAELWGQLRDLYDGYAGKESGQGSSSKYSGLKVSLLAGSTPAIDGQILIHQDLGTRELLYRTSGNKNKELVMLKCFENEKTEEDIKKELAKVTCTFLKNAEIRKIEPSKETLYELQKIALFTSYMRSNAEFDSYTNDLRSYVYPEEPTRIAKQLKRLFTCLMSLDKNYDEKKALNILWHIGKSSAFPLRLKVFNLLKENPIEFSTSQLSDILDIGKSTAKRECSVLQNIGLVSCRKQETNYPDKFYEYWKINSKIKPLSHLKLSMNDRESVNSDIPYNIFMDAFGIGKLSKENIQDINKIEVKV